MTPIRRLFTFSFNSNEISGILETHNLSKGYYSEEFLTKEFADKSFKEVMGSVKNEDVKTFLSALTTLPQTKILFEKISPVIGKSTSYVLLEEMAGTIRNKDYEKARIGLRRVSRHMNSAVFNNIERKLRSRGLEKMSSLISQSKVSSMNVMEFLSVEASRVEGAELKEIMSGAGNEISKLLVFALLSELLNKHASNELVRILCLTTLFFKDS